MALWAEQLFGCSAFLLKWCAKFTKYDSLWAFKFCK